jgi:hypothetical protein
MTADNFKNVLEALCDHVPFHPFTVELNTGKRFEVDYPRAMVIRDGVAVYLQSGGIPVWFDHKSVSQIERDIAGSSN